MTEANSDDSMMWSRRFRMEREASWYRLEDLLERAVSKSAKTLSDDELLELPRVYRSTLSSLSVARATSLDKDLISYLESLCTRAYFFIYGTRSTLSEKIIGFLRGDWSQAVRSIWVETLVSFVITLLGGLAAFMLVQADPDWYYSFMPELLANGRTPAASTESLRAGLYDGQDGAGYTLFATSLFTHNATVAIFAFALGFAFCAPTIMLLLYNGCVFGAFVSLYVQRDLGYEVGGWLLIHGVTELFAIILAGAAGLKIGWAIISPGDASRTVAAAKAGQQAALVLAGVIIMLLIAGLIEGFGRQLIVDDVARYGIAALSAVIWGVYFYLPGVFRKNHG